MTATQPPLWDDSWEAEADAKAGRRPQPRRRWAKRVPGDHGRPAARQHIPDRPVVNVPIRGGVL